MNFLAHAYLSFRQPNILVGQMISDFVKGKKQYDYPDAIQKGIKLHRAIDDFTDTHAATHEAKQYFKADYRLYAGAFVDVAYDHFLANDTSIFPTPKTLMETALQTYSMLQENYEILPENFQRMLPYMQQQNWLYNYRTIDGMSKSFAGLVRRSKYLTDSNTAVNILEENFKALQNCYQKFFPELMEMVKNRLNNDKDVIISSL
jgi:acyl carrier protein phosphodiesterase